ncbi:hypothetical protein F5Y12DRAFT_729647 [Xylaria sp. FL1777]|nr:hypothetical protein F5Y12DRAFT_729647 [Xylaria sp. FL1777]
MALLSNLNRRKKAETENERRRSFGIGGAGNIRTRDQAVVQDAYDLVERRRSRVSSSSIESPTKGGQVRRSSSISDVLKHAFTSSSK